MKFVGIFGFILLNGKYKLEVKYIIILLSNIIMMGVIFRYLSEPACFCDILKNNIKQAAKVSGANMLAK